jgi:DNA-binding NtrC family response regulator
VVRADRFFAELAQNIESSAIGVTALACEVAREHSWPGNVRELRNRMERPVALTGGRRITPGDLFPEQSHRTGTSGTPIAPLGEAREEAEKRHIQRALAITGGAILPAAKPLEISRTTLWEKMKRHGLAGIEP